jgi:hypothetical protein
MAWRRPGDGSRGQHDRTGPGPALGRGRRPASGGRLGVRDRKENARREETERRKEKVGDGLKRPIFGRRK